MAPHAGVRALKAAEHGDTVATDALKVGEHLLRIEWRQDFRLVSRDEFLGRHAVEPRPWLEFAIQAPARRDLESRCAATEFRS